MHFFNYSATVRQKIIANIVKYKGYLENKEAFQCTICFDDYQKGEGVTLSQCSHTFCKDCLAQTIEFSEEPEVKCPFNDGDKSCDSILQVC